MNRFLPLALMVVSLSYGQKESKKNQRDANEKVYQGNELNQRKQYTKAEVKYREAMEKNKNNAVATYNMGEVLYRQNAQKESLMYFQETVQEKEATKKEKHRAYHNIGNIMMEEKQYDKAVDAYKQALRLEPSDEQTRYNLALAKKFLKENPPKNQNKDQDKKQENKNKNQEKQDKQNNQGDNKQDNKENKDDKNQNKQDDNKQDSKDQNQQENQQDQQKQGSEKGTNQGISPEQASRILEAMNAKESKTQQKISAKKVKGRPGRTKKDW